MFPSTRKVRTSLNNGRFGEDGPIPTRILEAKARLLPAFG